MRRLSLALAGLMLVLAPAASRAQLAEPEPDPPTPFDRGRISLGLGLGSQSSFGERYFVAGGAFGYYVLSGLEVGVRGAKWFGDGPSVANITPAVRFVAFMVPGSIKPFIGTFYSHWFIGDAFDDVDSVGGTLGIVWHQGRGLVLSVGATVERIVSECTADCTDVYPALSLGLSF